MPRARPLKPAFADAAALVRGHPGYPQLQAVEGEIALLRRAAGATVPVGFALEAAVLEPVGSPAAVAERSRRRMEAAIAAEMRLAERPLRREAARRLARESETLNAAAREAIAAEQARLDDLLSRRRREIELRYRGPQTRLELRLEAAQRWLDASPLAIGVRAQAELERSAAQSELEALRARKAAEIEAAQRDTQSALDAFAAAQEEGAAKSLAAARERSDREIAETLQQQREALLEEATAARAPSPIDEAGAALSLPVQGHAPAPPAGRSQEGGFEGPQAAGVTVGDEIARLQRLHARMAASLTEQTKAAAVVVGRRHEFEITFERRGARDLTARLAQWLDEYWQAGAEP